MKYGSELYRDNLSKNTFLFIYLGIKQSFNTYFYETSLTWGTNSQYEEYVIDLEPRAVYGAGEKSYAV